MGTAILVIMAYSLLLISYGTFHYFFIYKPNKKRGKSTGFLTGKKKTL